MQQLLDNMKAISNICGLSTNNNNVSKAVPAKETQAVSNVCGLFNNNYNVSQAVPAKETQADLCLDLHA